MFSIYTLKSAKDAAKYYQKDNYYAKEEGAGGYSAWYGKGAHLLNLQKEVQIEHFQQKLGGKLSDEVEMIQTRNCGHHRPGYDLTFSAPKSVSILGIIGKDENVVMAHRKAVMKTLDYLESNNAAVRSKINGETIIEKTDNLTFAVFEHTDSRALDPNLHTHSILMNFTQRKDGKWRTIYGDDLYTNKIMIGMMYRSVLAKELMSMGYNVVQTSEKGTFELDGFDDKLLQQFSKRRQQINEKLSEMGQRGGKAAKMANFLTRSNKKELDLEQIELQWKNDLQACGHSIDWLNQYSHDAKKRGPVLQDTNEIIQKSVGSALNELSEKKAVFSIEELLKTSFGLSLIHATKGDLLEEIINKIEKGDLLHVGNNFFTTPPIREKEISIALNMRQDKNKVKPLQNIMIAGLITKLIGHEHHRAAIKHVITSSDRQIAVQSKDKQDFYLMMTTLSKIGKQLDYYPIYLTKSSASGRELKAKAGLNRVYTVHGFLESCEVRAQKKDHKPASKQYQYQARQLWVLDPNTKVNLDQAEKLQKWAKHFGARIIWSGHEGHSSPIFSLLKNRGIAYSSLEKSVTSEERDLLVESMRHMHEQGQFQALSDPKERIAQLTDYYLSLPKDNRTVLVLSQADRLKVNQTIREKMLMRGELSQEFVKYKSLQPLYFSAEQKQLAHLYQPEDVIHFRGKGNYFTVHEINIQKNTLTLMNNENNKIQWQPNLENDKVDIYRTESRELRIGDKITWTKTYKDKANPALTRNQGDAAQVVSLNNNTAQVSLMNGSIVSLDRADPRQSHFEHEYAKMLTQTFLDKDHEAVLLISTTQVPYVEKGQLTACLQDVKNIRIFCDDAVGLQTIMLEKKNQPHLATDNKVIAFHKSNSTSAFSRLSERVTEVSTKASIGDPVIGKEFPLTEKQKIAYEAVDYVCSRFSEREAVFSLSQAKQEAFMLAGLKVSKDEIENSFKVALDANCLIKVSEDKVTTQGTTLVERACLEFVKQGQGAVEPILSANHPILKVLEDSERLTKGQKDAVALALTTSDRVIGVQGVAGAGKTTMLKEINKSCREVLNQVDRLSHDAGFRLMGLANTASAKNRIIDATQSLEGTAISAMTVKKFIQHADKLLTNNPELAKSMYGKNQIFILDEASLASTKDVFSILSLVNRLEARLLLVGDVKQLSPIESGNPWRLLLGSEMKSVAIKENVRFKDPQTVAVMKDLYAGNINDAIKRLESKTIEIPDRKELLKAIANFYVSQSKEAQEKTLVISPRNEDRVVINGEIRELLKKDGTLLGNELKTQVLVQKDMTQVEKNSVYSYQEGDWVRFNYNDKRLSVHSGDYLQVVGKDLKNQKLLLKGSEDRNVLWSPHVIPRWSGAIEVYQAEQRSLMVGESIRWKKNDESRSLVNGETAKLIKLEDSSAKLSFKNGKIVDIDLKALKNQHWDHAYVSTVFIAQGQDVSLTMGLCQGPKPYEKETKDLRVGDSIILPADLKSGKASSLAIVNKSSDAQLILKDRKNQLHTFNTQDFIGRKWSYFPPFNERKPSEIPASSNMSSFLVQATRGDNFVMFVDNLDYFKKTIEIQSGIKETATQYLDPEWSKTLQKIQNMTQGVKGAALNEKTVPLDVGSGLVRRFDAILNEKAQTNVKDANRSIAKENEELIK